MASVLKNQILFHFDIFVLLNSLLYLGIGNITERFTCMHCVFIRNKHETAQYQSLMLLS